MANFVKAFVEGWLDRLRSRRDRLIASPDFQRWSLANPLTRLIARRRARAAFDLTAGFVYSQVLFACARLKLFDVLIAGPLTVPDLADRLGLSEEATRRLLDAAASLDLAEQRGTGRYGLGQLGAAFAGNRAALSLVEHQPLLYADLADPVALLRSEGRARPSASMSLHCGLVPDQKIKSNEFNGLTRLSDYWPYSDLEQPKALKAEQVAPYSALMAASQPMVAQEALDAYDMKQHRRLMDVGGGEGVFLCAAAARAPELQLTLVDLPAVAERARGRLQQAGLASRADAQGADFLRDPLPKGADVVTLIRIVHDQDDARALMLLRNIRAALEPGATLLIIEAMSDVKGAEPLDAYYGFYTLAMGRGEPRRVEEIQSLLAKTGFGEFRLLPNALPTLTSILVARAI